MLISTFLFCGGKKHQYCATHSSDLDDGGVLLLQRGISVSGLVVLRDSVNNFCCKGKILSIKAGELIFRISN